MARQIKAKRLIFFMVGLVTCLSIVIGCKKSKTEGNDDRTVVSIMESDLNPDGTISDSGLQKVSDKSNAPNLTVVFYRSRLTDKGLEQLGQFANLKRVEAIGSRTSPVGIERLKSVLPQVEVIR
jgi:hypothetical protein